MGIINTYRENTNRQSNYRQWSERATIVSYDAATQTYDIVVTAIGPTGQQVSNTNRALRRIKSLLPTDLRTFSPGDSVLVGYVSEQREHPIILGAGDHVAPTINTPVVSLPTNTSPATYTGPVSGGVGSPTSQPACPPRVVTGGTSNSEIVVDCANLEDDQVFDAPVQVFCTGTVQVQWSWNFPGGTVETSGQFGQIARLKFPTNNPLVAGVAYRVGKYHICNGGFNAMDVVSYGCDDEAEVTCSKNVANSNKYDPDTCSFCGDGGTPACGGSQTEDTELETNDPEFGTGGTCFLDRPCDPEGTLCDARTQSMKDDGCNPCGLARDSILTATLGDAVITITVIVAPAE